MDLIFLLKSSLHSLRLHNNNNTQHQSNSTCTFQSSSYYPAPPSHPNPPKLPLKSQQLRRLRPKLLPAKSSLITPRALSTLTTSAAAKTSRAAITSAKINATLGRYIYSHIPTIRCSALLSLPPPPPRLGSDSGPAAASAEDRRRDTRYRRTMPTLLTHYLAHSRARGRHCLYHRVYHRLSELARVVMATR